ncbi:hypothetical protein PENTCL1PPCAC_7299, partial [Pristionchus entomophagus]
QMSTRSFCSELRCLKYFCDICWKVWHNSSPTISDHRPMLKGLHQQHRYTSGNVVTDSYRSRPSAPPSPFATGGAHSPPSSAGPFGGFSFWQHSSAAAAAAAMAAAARVSVGGSLRGLSGSSPYGGYPSLLSTPAALLYANGTLAPEDVMAASSMGRRAGMSTAANLRLADLHGAFGRERMMNQLVAEMGVVRPPSAFDGSSSSSSLTGGISTALPTPGTGGFASASSSTTTQFTFDDVHSFSPPAESPQSPNMEKSKQSHKFFGF